MASSIDDTKPTEGNATTASVRTNFGHAKTEIEALQAAVAALQEGALVKPGTIIDFAGTAAPAGYLACPLVATNISRTTYAALFAAIGTTWGAGDGSTTFGMPYFPADNAAIQANNNVGTASDGVVKNHTHPRGAYQNAGGGLNSGNAAPYTLFANTDNPTGGGTQNLAAGLRVLKCVKV